MLPDFGKGQISLGPDNGSDNAKVAITDHSRHCLQIVVIHLRLNTAKYCSGGG